MTNQELILGVMRAQGKADALDLRARAPELDGTALIDEENKIPVFDGSKDYSSWKAGSPVRELVDGEWQVFTLITPHNASSYPGSTPSNTPALWSIRHTKDPKRAKPWLAPNGAHDAYQTGEYMIWTDGQTYRCTTDNTVWGPDTLPSAWTVVQPEGGAD